jgi:uncharacterized protein YndB with AHSA1/START domain
MDTFDWSRFVLRINVHAPAGSLYDAWTTRLGIESWFLRRADFRGPDGQNRQGDEHVLKGDRYTWYWHGWPDETREQGEILNANGADMLAFSFGKAGNCAVRIVPFRDERIVELTQENIPVDEAGKRTWHIGCKTGWTFYMANLKSILEGGIDLRNRDLETGEFLNK